MPEVARPLPELDAALGAQAPLLRCLECRGTLALTAFEGDSGDGANGLLTCTGCGEVYPIRRGTPRMLRPAARDAAEQRVKQQTAESFAYEWQRFGRLRDEWQRNFRDYMQPHPPEHFEGLLLLDVGTGSGRHSHHAAAAGARVVSVDLGDSIDVARQNLPPSVLTVQADAEDLPFESGAFDQVMSIGVLHHLPDTERALRAIVPFTRPGGEVRVYLYWVPEQAWHRRVLRLVTVARRVTVKLPHRLLHALCYPVAALLFGLFVLPYRVLRGLPRARRLADGFPLKAYADYPFSVCVNDQFDRFSAPIERRYTRAEVERMLTDAGLECVQVWANHGWVAHGLRP